MPTYSCPKGHQSNESDFCSECGARIQPAPPATGAPCPDCGAPRTDISSTFCEVCGYNFSTGTHGNIAEPEPPPAPATEPAPAPAPEPPPPPPPPISWTVTAVADPSLRDPEGPEIPADSSPLTLALDKPTILIGRRSEKRGIFPELSIEHDDGVSHRHALLIHGDGDALALRDIGSSNGTRLNGAELQPLVDTPVHDGDQITVGRWTRITVKAG